MGDVKDQYIQQYYVNRLADNLEEQIFYKHNEEEGEDERQHNDNQ